MNEPTENKLLKIDAMPAKMRRNWTTKASLICKSRKFWFYISPRNKTKDRIKQLGFSPIRYILPIHNCKRRVHVSQCIGIRWISIANLETCRLLFLTECKMDEAYTRMQLGSFVTSASKIFHLSSRTTFRAFAVIKFIFLHWISHFPIQFFALW